MSELKQQNETVRQAVKQSITWHTAEYVKTVLRLGGLSEPDTDMIQESAQTIAAVMTSYLKTQYSVQYPDMIPDMTVIAESIEMLTNMLCQTAEKICAKEIELPMKKTGLDDMDSCTCPTCGSYIMSLDSIGYYEQPSYCNNCGQKLKKEG